MDEASLFLINSPPYNFSPDPISSHPLKDFASISLLTEYLHKYSYCSIISYQNKHTKTPNKHALAQPSLNSTYMLPAISFNFSALLHGKLRVVLKAISYCLLTYSHYVLIQIGFYCSPLHCAFFQIHISSTGLFLEFYAYIYVQLPLGHLYVVINRIFQI